MLLVTALAHAQDEDINQYISSYTIISSVVETFTWSMIYLGLYALGLGAAIVLQQRWAGFDVTLMWWVIGLWLGGSVITGVAYYSVFPPLPPAHLGDPSLKATLLSMPLIFGWSMLLCTRTWADLMPKEALIASLAIMLLCAPYYGPNVRIVPAKTFPKSAVPALRQLGAAPQHLPRQGRKRLHNSYNSHTGQKYAKLELANLSAER